MASSSQSRFIFLGGIPVFDYIITPSLQEIFRAVANDLIMIDDKILLPLGTIFVCQIEDEKQPLYVNPMAACEVQKVNEKYYYTMALGGKHTEHTGLSLCSLDPAVILAELNRVYPEIILSLIHI